MIALSGHLFLYSAGLVASGVIAWIATVGLRRDPVACHRMLVAILYASLLLPIAQFVVENVVPANAPAAAPIVRQIARGLLAPETTARAAAVDPIAPPIHAATSTASSAPQRTTQAPVAAAKPAPKSAPNGVSAARTKSIPITAPPAPSFRERVLAQGDRAVWIWLGGALLFLVLQGFRLLRTARFLSRCSPVRDPEVLDVWRRVAHGSPLFHRIRLLESDSLSAPACWGALTPAIVLPSATLVDRKSLAFALLHELVHLERRDPRTRIAQGVFTALYWFHPAAWWLSFQLDRVREQSCDLDVVSRVGRRKSYALALVQYAALPAPNADPLPTALHWSRSHSQLRRRILMLTDSRAPASRGRRYLYAGAAGLVLAGAWASQIAIASAFPTDDSKLVAFCPPKKTEAPQQVQPPRAPARPSNKMRSAPTPTPNAKPPCCDPKSEDAKPDKNSDASDVTRSTPAPVNPQLYAFPSSLFQPTVAQNGATSLLTAYSPPPADLDDDVREALIRTLLHDDHPSVRRAAAEALAPHVGDARVKEALVATLREHGDDGTRAMLLDTLLARETISDDVRDVLHDLVGAESRATPDAEALHRQLIQFALDENDRARQTAAALALAQTTDDEDSRATLIRLLMQGNNEPARMVALKALTPWLTQSDDVRDLFTAVVQRDTVPSAKAAAADALVNYAGDENIRRVMSGVLAQIEDPVIAQRFVLALAPFALEADVKQAFIASLAHADDEAIRATLVDALAGAPRAAFPAWSGMLLPENGVAPTPSNPQIEPPVVDVKFENG